MLLDCKINGLWGCLIWRIKGKIRSTSVFFLNIDGADLAAAVLGNLLMMLMPAAGNMITVLAEESHLANVM